MFKFKPFGVKNFYNMDLLVFKSKVNRPITAIIACFCLNFQIDYNIYNYIVTIKFVVVALFRILHLNIGEIYRLVKICSLSKPLTDNKIFSVQKLPLTRARRFRADRLHHPPDIDNSIMLKDR